MAKHRKYYRTWFVISVSAFRYLIPQTVSYALSKDINEGVGVLNV